MAKLKIQHTSVSSITTDRFVSPVTISGNHVGATGGNVSQTGSQIAANVFIGAGPQVTTGFIVKQKGAHKYRVNDGSGNLADCKLVNAALLANATLTTSNTMSVAITLANAAVIYASRITNRWVYDFNGNKYRYWTAAATTSNSYPVDARASNTAFVQIASS